MKLRKPKSVTVNGHRYELVWRKPPNNKDGTSNDGMCTSPHMPKRKIWIDPNLPPRKQAETIIHEIDHAGLWCVDEEYIAEIARAAADVLERRGLLCLGCCDG